METRSNHILVGSVVMAMLVAMLGFIIWLSQASGDQDKRYDIFFDQAVDGLAKGSAVTFSGVPVGQVESINLLPDTPEKVRVRITVNRIAPVLVGTTATLKGVGFTGVTQIQLDPPEVQAGQRRPSEIVCPEQNPSPRCPYGVPVIRPKPGGIAAILNSAPELIENVTKLTGRLTELLSSRNQNSIAAILENVQVMSKNLAERSDEIAATMADARIAIRQAGDATERFGRLADTTNGILERDARPLVADLRRTVQSANSSMKNLDALLGEARPGVQTFSTRTLPEVGQLVRDLRATSQSLRSISERLDQQGIGGALGGEKLPEYRPQKRR